MTNLHEKLLENSKVYSKWHKHPAHKTIHWAVFLFVSGLLTLSLVNSISQQGIGENDVLFSRGASAKGPDGEKSLKLAKLNTDLLNAANRLSKAKQNEKTALTNAVVQLAKSRREVLLQEMGTNASLVVKNSLSTSLKKRLPAEAQGYLEEQTTLDGTLVTWHDHEFSKDGKVSSTTHHNDFYTKNGKLRAHFDSNESGAFSEEGIKTKLTGVKIGDDLAVGSSSLGNKAPAKLSTIVSDVDPNTGVDYRKSAVFVFGFQGAGSSVGASEIRSSMNQFNNFYEEASLGKQQWSGQINSDTDVFGPYTLPYSNSEACTRDWFADLGAMAAPSGYDELNYDFIVMTAQSAGCNPAVHGHERIMFVTSASVPYLVHEYGHIMGMYHANALSCTNASGAYVAISDNCVKGEYGDGYSVMGSAAYTLKHHNNFMMGQTDYRKPNWFDPQNILTIDSSTPSDMTYTLASADTPSPGVQVIKIPGHFSYVDQNGVGIAYDGAYYLEFRQPYGFDNFSATDPVVKGVTIRIAPQFDAPHFPTNTYDGSEILAVNNPLQPGKTFQDIARGITITTLSSSASGAIVKVTVGPVACLPSSPSLIVSPASVAGEPGSTQYYSVSVTNMDNGACDASEFTVNPTLPSGWVQTPASFSQILGPGQNAIFGIAVTSDPASALGSYVISQKAINTSTTMSSTVSAGFVLKIVDSIAPTTSITYPTNGLILKKASKVLVSAIASDNVGVTKVEISADNKVVCTDTTAPYTCTWNVAGKAGAHTVKSKAYDAAGNSTISSVINVTAK